MPVTTVMPFGVITLGTTDTSRFGIGTATAAGRVVVVLLGLLVVVVEIVTTDRFGPVLGAFVLTGLAETLNAVMAAVGLDIPGAKQVFYGICLLVVIVALPEGVWPPLARRLGLTKAKP